MSDLDDKLRDIVSEYAESHEQSQFDEQVRLIKQAFKDDAWSAIPEKEVYDRVLKYDNQTICSQCQNRFTTQEDCLLHYKLHDPTMTGQEWYDRFTKEMNGVETYSGDDYYGLVSDDEVLDAAKRATGIE